MAFETGTASNQYDLLTKIRTFVTTTMTPSAQRWTELRWIGVRETTTSSFFSGYEGYRVLDNGSGQWRTAVGQQSNSFVSFRFVKPIDFRRFILTGAASAANRSPKDFSIQYSSDGTNWTTLESWTNQTTWNFSESRTFNLTAASPGAKEYWRLFITANNGATDHTEIDALQFLEPIGIYYLSHTVDPQLTIRGPGLAGTEEIYAGIGIYSNPTSDTYNLRTQVWTGFVPSSNFFSQPGGTGFMGCPVWNSPMTYWIVANGARIVVVVKTDTVYDTFYLGKYLPYATPGQLPYPVCHGNTWASDQSVRYSDTTRVIPYKGSRSGFKIRTVSGTWIEPQSWPWVNGTTYRDTGGQYPMQPVILTDSSPNVYGELDGVYYVTGFSNTAENIIVAGGVNHLVVPDIFRTGLRDYFALKLA